MLHEEAMAFLGATDHDAALLKLGEIAQALRAPRRPISSWSALCAYLRADMQNLSHERFRVLYLDNKNNLIADEASDGDVSFCAVHPRQIIKRALLLDAVSLIVVHNHPTGDATPSQPDIAVTKQIIEAAKVFKITLHDHVIVGTDVYSFRAHGLLSH